MRKHPSHVYEFGPFRLDTQNRLLFRDGQAVQQVPPKIMETLITLVERAGRVVSKEDLMQLIWPDSFVEESNLTQNIFMLRKILGGTEHPGPYIETVPRRGYRFVAPLKELRAPGPKAAGTLTRSTARGKERKDLQGKSIDSIAILLLRNESAGLNADYLSNAISESIINNLSKLPALRVMARSAVFRYKGREVTARRVGQDLDVRAVVMGEVFLRGDSLHVHIEAIDVADESLLLGQQYDRKLVDLFEAQREISQDFSSELKLRLANGGPQRSGVRRTEATKAHQLYLVGRYYQNKMTEEGLTKGREHFQRAVDLEPAFASAYAGLADSYALGGLSLDPNLALAYAELDDYYSLLSSPPKEAMSKAKAAALRALEIDETLAEAHTSMGLVRYRLDWAWAAAEEEFKRAIELNQDYAPAHLWYGAYLKTVGRFDEASVELKRAQTIDPLLLIVQVELGRIYYFAGSYDKAIRQYEKMLEMDPFFIPAHFCLGQAYAQKGLFERALEEFQTAVPRMPDDRKAIAGLGYVYALSGRRDEAQEALDKLKELSMLRHVPSYDLALIYLALGENDKALECLQHAYAERSADLIDLKIEPMLSPLRPEPQFTELMRRVRLIP